LLSPFYVRTTQVSDYVNSQYRQLLCKLLVKQALSLTHFVVVTTHTEDCGDDE